MLKPNMQIMYSTVANYRLELVPYTWKIFYHRILLFFIVIFTNIPVLATDTLSLNGLFEKVEQADEKEKIEIYKMLSEKFKRHYKIDTTFKNLYKYYSNYSTLPDSLHMRFIARIAYALNYEGYFNEASKFLDKWLSIVEKKKNPGDIALIKGCYGYIFFRKWAI